MSVSLNHVRHLQVFDPARFGDIRVDVVGCGAVGSRIAIELAKLGVTNLHIWDADIIEDHNLANQQYSIEDIGQTKVDALKKEILRLTNISATVHPYFLEDEQDLGQVVFLAVDTMSARKNIFEKCLHLRLGVKNVIEVRMGVEEFRVYSFNPSSRNEVQKWLSTIVDDKVTVESACGSRTTVGSTAMITAGFAMQRFLQYYKKEIERDPNHALETHIEWTMLFRPLVAIAN